MEKKLVKHIIELLKDNECVVIPGFGGFILKPVSAGVSNNVFSPAHKEIGFNKSLTADDGLLTGALMGSENFDYSKAQNEVNKFSNYLSFTLKRDKEYLLEGLGKFFTSANDVIKFQPVHISHIDKSSYGFRNISALPVIREKTVKQIASRTKSVRKSGNRQIISLGIVSLLFATVLTLIFTNNSIKSLHLENADFVGILFDNTQTELTPVMPRNAGIESAYEVASLQQRFEEYFHYSDEGTSFEYLSIQNNSIPKGFYIIVGSYATMKNAERKEAELFNEGKDSYILESKKGFFRVAVFAGSKKNEAEYKLTASKTTHPDLWVILNN